MTGPIGRGSSPPRICVIGSCNVDLTAVAPRLPRAGETVFGLEFHRAYGGKGANQAVAAARLGAQVRFIGRVGDDPLGREAMANLEGYGVQVEGLRATPHSPTGVASIWVDSRGQNRIVVVPGANERLTPQDVVAAAPLLEECTYLLLQLEVPLPTVEAALALAGQRGIRVILNPAPAKALPRHLFPLIEVLVPNEVELFLLLGLSPPRPFALEKVSAGAKELLGWGPKAVVVTLGARGALLVQQGEAKHVPPYLVRPRDTTGAGDAFVGSLAVFLGEGRSLSQSVALANRYAALATQRLGTQEAYLSREEFEKSVSPQHKRG